MSRTGIRPSYRIGIDVGVIRRDVGGDRNLDRVAAEILDIGIVAMRKLMRDQPPPATITRPIVDVQLGLSPIHI